MDAEIQAMDGKKSVVQMLDSGDMSTRSFMFAVSGMSFVAPTVCHPWTLDFGIPAQMMGLQHLSNDESGSLGTGKMPIRKWDTAGFS